MRSSRSRGKNDRVILTSDKAFGERASRGAMTMGVILLRLHEVPPDDMVTLVVRILTSRDDWEHLLAVIDRKRVRTIPLPVQCRHPDGPAIALLRIAARHPRIIRENLESAA